MLILWDRLFGTFKDEDASEPVVFGVRKPLASWNPFWANLQVYDYLLFDARKAQRWQDKLSIWFRRTGWRPPDVAASHPKVAADLATFEKYDPPMRASVRRYVLTQFAVAIVILFFIADMYARLGIQSVIVPCVALWAQLFCLGQICEGRSHGATLELIRLVLLVPIATAGFLLQTAAITRGELIWMVVAVYVAVSLIGLSVLRNDK
jgi:hypothetical protein